MLDIKLSPNAKKNEISDIREDVVYIKITALPIEGKANKALIDFLAKQFKTAKSNIEIVNGLTSKSKRVQIDTPKQLPECVAVFLKGHEG